MIDFIRLISLELVLSLISKVWIKVVNLSLLTHISNSPLQLSPRCACFLDLNGLACVFIVDLFSLKMLHFIIKLIVTCAVHQCCIFFSCEIRDSRPYSQEKITIWQKKASKEKIYFFRMMQHEKKSTTIDGFCDLWILLMLCNFHGLLIVDSWSLNV